jgi:hypothetical protein
VRILPGDPNKQSLKDCGLTFEMILEAIDNGGLLNALRDKLERLANRHGSMSLAAEAAIKHAKVA